MTDTFATSNDDIILLAFILLISHISAGVSYEAYLRKVKHMHIRKHSFRERNLWRGFLYINDPEYTRRGVDLRLEVSWNKWRGGLNNLGFKIHFGNSGSETPFHFHLYLIWIHFFFSMRTPRMGKIFEKFCGGHKRDISLQFFSGQMWWKLWYDDDMGYDRHHKCDNFRRPPWFWPWKNKKSRQWMCLRSGNLELNPLNVWWGTPKYSYETIDERPEEIVGIYQFEDDFYEVNFTLQEVWKAREHGPAFLRKSKFQYYTAKWLCYPGIPTQNHSWKGDNTLGSSVRIEEGTDAWIGEAHRKLQDWVIKERERRNYQPPRTSQDELLESRIDEMLKNEVIMDEMEIPDLSKVDWKNAVIRELSMDREPNAFGEVMYVMSGGRINPKSSDEEPVELETGFIDKIDGEPVTLEKINENRAKDGLDPLPKED